MNLFKNDYQELCQDNIDESVSLKGENYAVLDRMMQYLSGYDISLFELEVVKKDLIGIAREAETENQTLQNKLGVPEKEFCDTLLADAVGKNPWDRILLWAKDLLIGICGINTLFFLVLGCPERYGITLSSLFYGIGLVAVRLLFTDKIRNRFVYSKHRKAADVAAVLGGVLLTVIWVLLPIERVFIISGNGWWVTAWSIAVTVAAYLGNNLYWNLQSRKYHWE